MDKKHLFRFWPPPEGFAVAAFIYLFLVKNIITIIIGVNGLIDRFSLESEFRINISSIRKLFFQCPNEAKSTGIGLIRASFLLYGGLFTVGVDFILYPLELLKTRVQVEAKSRATLFEASVSAYRGVLQQNGVRGLWSGFPLYTIGGLPSQGAYFYGYQWAVSRCTAWNSSRSENSRLPLFMIDMAAGFFADVVAAPLWTPTEVVSSRLQIQGPGVVKYDGALHAVRHIFATEGFPGFFSRNFSFYIGIWTCKCIMVGNVSGM
jgi:hypothetical protein